MYDHLNEKSNLPFRFEEKKSYKEHPERRLTGIFRRDGHYYEISCTSSPCKTKCHFCHPYFGEAVFERDSEILLASTLQINEDYMLFLRRLVAAWKLNFPNHWETLFHKKGGYCLLS